jgi:hypothetical protein
MDESPQPYPHCSARHLSSVHQTKFREPAKPRNIVDPPSLLGGQ